MMKRVLALEEFFLFLLSIFLFHLLNYPWWLFPVLLLAPDLSMAGYLFNPRLGAILYNLVHHRAVGISLYVLGALWGIQPLQLAGLILFGHSCLDRVLGYGLKYSDSFQNTHLGRIGPGKNAAQQENI